jgi:hypothetical protein
MPSPNPEFYGSVAGATAYHTSRGNTGWLDSPEDAAEAALIRASVWLDGTYGHRWSGTMTDGEQYLAWPRTDATTYEGFAIADDVVPRSVEHATYEAALRELATPGSLSPDFTPSQGVKSETVGPISITYRDGMGREFRPIASVVDDLLAPLIGRRSSAGSSFVLRA